MGNLGVVERGLEGVDWRSVHVVLPHDGHPFRRGASGQGGLDDVLHLGAVAVAAGESVEARVLGKVGDAEDAGELGDLAAAGEGDISVLGA